MKLKNIEAKFKKIKLQRHSKEEIYFRILNNFDGFVETLMTITLKYKDMITARAHKEGVSLFADEYRQSRYVRKLSTLLFRQPCPVLAC